MFAISFLSSNIFMRCKNSYSIEQFSLRFYCIRDAILLHAFSDELCHKLNERIIRVSVIFMYLLTHV